MSSKKKPPVAKKPPSPDGLRPKPWRIEFDEPPCGDLVNILNRDGRYVIVEIDPSLACEIVAAVNYVHRRGWAP